MKRINTILSLLIIFLLTGCTDILNYFNKKESTTNNGSIFLSETTTTKENNLPYIDGKKLVVFGDSITSFGTWGESTAKELNMYFYNAALGGITTEQGFNRFDTYVKKQNPDFVTILFGHNDLIMTEKNKPRVSIEKFKENLTEYVEMIRDIDAIPILLTNAPLNEDIFFDVQGQDENNYSDVGTPLEWLDKYNEAIREVAKETSCDLVDNRITFSDKYYKKYLSDGIHLNSKGNEKFRENLVTYFKERYQNDPSYKMVSIEDTYLKIDENNKKYSIVSFKESDWFTVDNNLLKFIEGDSNISLYNTNGLWPEAHYVPVAPIIISYNDGYLSYDIETKNVTTSLIIFFDGATPSGYSDNKYIVINNYITTNTNEALDIKENQHHVGEIKLTDLNINKDLIKDGKIVVSGLKVFVAGTKNQKVIISDLSLYIK